MGSQSKTRFFITLPSSSRLIELENTIICTHQESIAIRHTGTPKKLTNNSVLRLKVSGSTFIFLTITYYYYDFIIKKPYKMKCFKYGRIMFRSS